MAIDPPQSHSRITIASHRFILIFQYQRLSISIQCSEMFQRIISGLEPSDLLKATTLPSSSEARGVYLPQAYLSY
eukprot:snap_masked-scaffold_28-processed-gene-2.40-mRNA-1 protein AED:1.00 eAED:1.00 QI:0/0/0/0/1/1/2/0/74